MLIRDQAIARQEHKEMGVQMVSLLEAFTKMSLKWIILDNHQAKIKQEQIYQQGQKVPDWDQNHQFHQEKKITWEKVRESNQVKVSILVLLLVDLE